MADPSGLGRPCEVGITEELERLGAAQGGELALLIVYQAAAASWNISPIMSGIDRVIDHAG